MVLKNKKILLGVTGSIAAYKAVDLARRLSEAGAEISVIMTDASMNFISPISFEIASRNRVYTDLLQEPMAHITLTSEAELMVIAPATANIIGKFANGIADDMLSTCLMSFKGKVIVAPAMNWRMYENPALQKNLQYLSSMGVLQVGPEKGSLACGEDAIGRMADVREILEAVRAALSKKDLIGRKIVVTAGPTREYMDPVRFLSNRSSGKMGYAIAGAALRRGAEVVLISGPSQVRPPSAADLIHVETTQEMRDAVIRNIAGCSAVIMAAAVADFSPAERSGTKIEKSDGLTLRLIKTPDILSEIGAMRPRPLLVGFAAETGDDLSRARRKLSEKGADIIVFNNVTSEDSGFDVDTNRITLIEASGETSFPLMSKDEAAEMLLDRVVNLFP
ncbi:MAG: bifunctional phosphopantothenoylcysteine decarboxylase/phosphopantothenate--cysteine ligase CoaBC [Thermodesulfovibrionales bacterium]